jgi:hypothetical protein
MATEQYANNATTVLSGAINSGASSLVVTSADLFPTSPQFRIRIDSELLLVTAVVGTTFTVTRGIEGTTAAAHAEGAVVRHVLTRDGLKGIGGSTVLATPFDSREQPGTVGRIFLPTNGYAAERDNGTLWQAWGPLFPLTAPISGDFAWTGQGGATLDTSGGMCYLSAPPAAGSNLRIRHKTAPATPYSVTIGFIPMAPVIQNIFPGMGLCFRQSSTGKLVTLGYTFENDPDTRIITRWGMQKWTDETTFSANYGSINWGDIPPWNTGPILWIKGIDDGTDLKFQVSNDGVHFSQIHSVSRTDFLLTTGPDQVGFWVNTNTASTDVGMLLLSWKES